MKIMLIPYLPTAVRAYPMAKYFSKAKNETHMILWNMPYPVSFSNIWDNLKNSLKYKKYKKEKVTIHKIRRLPFFFPIVNKWLFKKQVKRIYNDYSIDVIISETFFNETEPPLDLNLIYDIADDHESFPEIYGSGIYRFAYKILRVKNTIKNQIQKSIAVIAVSDLLVDYAKKYRDKGVFKIPNGVEGWVLNKKCLTGEKNSLVYVTNFGRWSRLLDVIKVVHRLKEDFPKIKLNLIGDGSEIPKAKLLVKNLKLDEFVIFLGRINNRHKLFNEINKSEVCLNISEKNRFRDSSSPMKYIEYSALGKKIVSTNVEEVKILDFPNTFIYKQDSNDNNLINAIKKAFVANIDVQKTKKMASEYSWEKINKRIEKIISMGIFKK
jgi:glycosyltransferase involved in cell wall biosynthesis